VIAFLATPLRSGITTGFDVVPEDLIEHSRQSLARYKVPRTVHIEETLPKNAVGKVAKPVLRNRLNDAGTPALSPMIAASEALAAETADGISRRLCRHRRHVLASTAGRHVSCP